MDDISATSRVQSQGELKPDTKPFLLCELAVGAKDKLGNVIAEILWLARDYAVYRSHRGVHVHFSDCPAEEDDQRRRFTQISPELCELRYLTAQMSSGWTFGLRRPPASIYHHNMAQAVMLVMEKKNQADLGDAKKLAEKTLSMAVERVTNDNMIRYLRVCLWCWVVVTVVALCILWAPVQLHWTAWEAVRPHIVGLKSYIVGGMFGATGAMLSVATRLQEFKFKPCHQSNMNYWMAGLRIGIGAVAGIVILIFARTILGDAIGKHIANMYWEAVAAAGLIAGFTERLVPGLLQRTANQWESSAGTPVQAAQE
ncbi:hypothetical protein CQ12_05760 [Bradyrhizobium jicamae]|uniref:Uncharacterized protein n=1 Tax=Bradyrhizobium jicamae TaxID=280332 RepID=A0A0R3LPU0_9BRAD|nr:hypothetical protein [Bradyrhizobium jicamae]KRR09921.1 hypothetical protein CQ12_05760 [Bradyrhizobium jicamae]